MDINSILEVAKLIVQSWTTWLILCLFVVIIILTWLLLKREKALQLMVFSISPIGIKLTYELNRKEKLQTLAIENIALHNELKALKATVKKERWKFIGLAIMMFVILILSRFKFKSKEGSTELLDSPENKEKKDNI